MKLFPCPVGKMVLLFMWIVLAPITSRAISIDHPESPCGVMIENLEQGPLLEAGLQPGDIIHRWTQSEPAEEAGETCSYSDWRHFAMEYAPRGKYTLEVARGDRLLSLEDIAPGTPAATMVPLVNPEILAAYRVGAEARQAGDIQQTIEVWTSLAESSEPEGHGPVHEWISLLLSGSHDLIVSGQTNESFLCSMAKSSSNQHVRASAWLTLGNIQNQRNEHNDAMSSFSSALLLRKESGPNHLGISAALANMASLATDLGQLLTAKTLASEAFEIHLKTAPNHLGLARRYNQLGIIEKELGNTQAAAALNAKALELQQKFNGDPLTRSRHLNSQAATLLTSGEYLKAERILEEALEINLKLAPQSTETASIYINLTTILVEKGDLPRAKQLLDKAMEIIVTETPDYSKLSAAYNSLGVITFRTGDLPKAISYFFKDIEATRKYAPPDSTLIAESLNNISLIYHEMGELHLAEDTLLQSLAIKSANNPNSPSTAATLANLGTITLLRGAVDDGYEYYLRAAILWSQITSNPAKIGESYSNLGFACQARGDYEKARDYYSKAMELFQNDPTTIDSQAIVFDNLSDVERTLGNIKQARIYQGKALAFRRQISANYMHVAYSLADMGAIEASAKNWERANFYLQDAKGIVQVNAPRSLALSQILANLGEIATETNDLRLALEYYYEAIRIQEALAPNRGQLAIDYQSASEILLRLGRREEAISNLQKGVEALEAQCSILGGSLPTLAKYRAEFTALYRDYQRLLFESTNINAAFHLEERFRARSLLMSLRERDLMTEANFPEELARDRRKLREAYDHSFFQLSQVATEDQQLRNEIQNRIAAIELEANELEAKIRSSSRQFGEMRYPSPLDLQAAREALEPGTLAVLFIVNPNETFVVTFTREGATKSTILPVKEDQLRSMTQAFRESIGHSKEILSTAAWRESQREEKGFALFELLFGPLSDQIEASERVLILPDGPLHGLPFGALLRKKPDQPGEHQYLIEWRPFHVTQSASVYAQLLGMRPNVPNKVMSNFLAFGDPLVEKSALDDSTSAASNRSPILRALGPRTPLPFSRRELDDIADLVPDGEGTFLIGENASEAQLKKLSSKASYLHLSTHAVTDEQFPMRSAILLAEHQKSSQEYSSGEENGLFQVWEIFEGFRLNAELVVLSGCETGLGQELSGEGLIGLTRAFHVAGARSVIASLWQVADESTSELMIRFYRNLKSGMSKDQALRAAQISLIREPIPLADAQGNPATKDFSAPFHWAAFQLYGDWQ